MISTTRPDSLSSYLSSGTLIQRTKVCGNPNCHCARDPAARHGPYSEASPYISCGNCTFDDAVPQITSEHYPI
jgi:hypothetical protein